MTTCLWSKRAHTNTDTNKTRDDTLLDHSQSLSQSSRFLCKFQRRKNTFCRLIHGLRWFIISSSRSSRAPINSRVVTSQTPHCWFSKHIAHQYHEHFIHRWKNIHVSCCAVACMPWLGIGKQLSNREIFSYFHANALRKIVGWHTAQFEAPFNIWLDFNSSKISYHIKYDGRAVVTKSLILLPLQHHHYQMSDIKKSNAAEEEINFWIKSLRINYYSMQ